MARFETGGILLSNSVVVVAPQVVFSRGTQCVLVLIHVHFYWKNSLKVHHNVFSQVLVRCIESQS
jgi:hypothetical protein